MDRRYFLKTFSAGVIGARLAGPADLFALTPEEASVLSVVKGEDAAAATIKAVEALGGMSNFVSKGDVVIVKPNIGWDRIPEQAATTNPHVVAELVRLSIEAGAKKVKVFDNTCNSARRCYKKSGIPDAATEAGADVFFVDERKYQDTNIGGEALQEWPVYKDALEADKIINVPIAKHHTLSRVTLAMKNLMGLIGGSRNLIHQKLDTAVVDLAAYFKPRLTVLDASRVLMANGPQGGNLADVKAMNTIAASTDQVAIDSYGATLFELTADDLRFVREAYDRGLGEKDLAKVKLIEQSLS
jgi:uncharacterized protein (DUF362 family)